MYYQNSKWGFNLPNPGDPALSSLTSQTISSAQSCLEALKKAKRPVLIFGWGIHLAKAEYEAKIFNTESGLPFVTTWGARDLSIEALRANIGGFGTHGTRAANFAVQNADWILAVGSRLDSKATGTPVESFARGAKIWMVDIDSNEIAKFNGRVEGICKDAREFFREARNLCAMQYL